MIGIIKLEAQDKSYKKLIRYSEFKKAEQEFNGFMAQAREFNKVNLNHSIYLYKKQNSKKILISVINVQEAQIRFIEKFKI